VTWTLRNGILVDETGNSLITEGLMDTQIKEEAPVLPVAQPNHQSRRQLKLQIKRITRRQKRAKLRSKRVIDDAVNRLISIQPKSANGPSAEKENSETI
jgi:hypothetical protein